MYEHVRVRLALFGSVIVTVCCPAVRNVIKAKPDVATKVDPVNLTLEMSAAWTSLVVTVAIDS